MPAEYDVIGSWSEVKLAILRAYAKPYSQILVSKGLYHLYIDAFAGPGTHVSRKTGEIITGSALNALATEPPFKEYHFIDKSRQRIQRLRRHAAGREDVYVHHGDCNDVLLQKVFPRAEYDQFRRALCVLDPYNIGLSWDVIAAAGKMRSIEIFVNFMVMDMNMNVLLTRPEKASPKQVARMTRFWGDDSWRDVAYEKNPQTHFWKEIEMLKVEDANEKVAEAYRKRLIEVAGFKFAPAPLPFRNKIGRTIYYLFFASPDPTANKIVHGIFDKYRHREWS
jgi:three-Cys-motif partner protein